MYLILYSQVSCYLQPNAFFTGLVSNREVGRKDFFCLPTPIFLIFPPLGPYGSQINPIHSSCLRINSDLQKETWYRQSYTPGLTAGAFCIFHTHSRVIFPNTNRNMAYLSLPKSFTSFPQIGHFFLWEFTSKYVLHSSKEIVCVKHVFIHKKLFKIFQAA